MSYSIGQRVRVCCRGPHCGYIGSVVDRRLHGTVEVYTLQFDDTSECDYYRDELEKAS